MKFKSMMMGSAVLAAIVAAVSSASAATSITLTVDYIGSATGNASGAGAATSKIAQNTGTGLSLATVSGGVVPTANMTVYTPTELGSDTVQSMVGLKNYFAVYLNFSTADIANQRVYGVGFNVTVPSGMTPISSTGLTDTTTSNKFVFYNPVDANVASTTWDTTISPPGVGDLNNIGDAQATFANAYSMEIGTPGALTGDAANGVNSVDASGYISGKGVLLGMFALTFTSTGVSGTVGAVSTTGNTAWYTDPNSVDGTPVYDSPRATSVNYTITAGVTTPEPASLGVLALGGLALLAKRRKAA